MNPFFFAQFKNESAHACFLNWLTAYEQEIKYDAEAKIRFVRGDGIFSVVTVHCTDANLEVLQNAALAFGNLV